MNGVELKNWVLEKQIKPEQLAVIMNVSIATVYKWYSAYSLEKRTVLALAHLGCDAARNEMQETTKMASFGR